MHQPGPEMVRSDSPDQVEGAGQPGHAATMAVADRVDGKSVALASPFPALPDKGKVPLLDVSLVQQPTDALAASLRLGIKIVELDLDIADILYPATVDEVVKQGEFAALDVDLKEVDFRQAGFRKEIGKGAKSHLLHGSPDGGGVEGAGSVGIIVHL